jgi:hypothetical protein
VKKIKGLPETKSENPKTITPLSWRLPSCPRYKRSNWRGIVAAKFFKFKKAQQRMFCTASVRHVNGATVSDYYEDSAT